MGDPTSTRATLRNKFELEKRYLSKPSPSNNTQKQKPIELEEIIKHMKHVPTYLERGKPIHDRALNFGVMDWGRLEQWQYRNNGNKPQVVTTTKCSPSSSITSSVFSTGGSSPQSSSVPSSSPARQKVHRVTLQAYFKASPKVETSFSKGEYVYENYHKELKTLRDDTSLLKNSVVKQRSISTDVKTSFSKVEYVNENYHMELQTSTDHTNLLKNSVVKQRSISPLRRFSFTKKPESDINRAHSSPLRRLLTGHQDSKTKTKLDFKNENKRGVFQTSVKNGRLLFTFAVENNDVLAATVTGLSWPEKGDVGNRVYTFFTVQEVKKKNASWLRLPQSGKNKEPEYVPNVKAQMKVFNPLNASFNIWEFVLFSVDSNVKMLDELEAIVVEFDRDGFGVTVVLPGGNHGAPRKGGPAPLVDRWRSGGVCDCGGWDMGCRLRVLASQVRSSGSRPGKVRVNAGPFELFFQGEVVNKKKPVFSLSPLTEGIFSVEFSSSLAVLQVFSICISVVESQRKLTPTSNYNC